MYDIINWQYTVAVLVMQQFMNKKKKWLSGTSKVPMTFKWGMRAPGET